MKNVLFLFLIFAFTHSFAQKVTESKKLTIGDQVTIHSIILNEDRLLNIYLPNNYKIDSNKRYPVIYLLDGSMDEDFIHISGLVQFGSFSWINMIPETIVVGISNIDRKRDFTFPATVEEHKKQFPTTGGSENFIQFIEKELQSFIEKQYRTTSEKTIIGQSLGGLLATEILLKKPELFDSYIIISPSLWWNNESLLEFPSLVSVKNKKIYIAVGKEGKIMESEAKALHKKIKKENPSMEGLYFNFFEKQNHGDVLHLACYDAFLHIFTITENK